MYRTNPCIVSAFQFDGDFMYSNGEYYVPKWAQEALAQKVLQFIDGNLYLQTTSSRESVVVEPGFYVALLPNNTMIAMSPIAFKWLFSETGED